MPSGRTHLVIQTGLGVGLGALAAQLGAAPDTATGQALMAGWIVGSVWVTPDLDMPRVRTAPLKAWGPLGVLWRPLLRVSVHRGVSHTYLRGPLIRGAYLWGVLHVLGVAVGSLAAAAHVQIDTAAFSDAAARLPWGYAYAAYHVAQWGHLAADGIPPRPARW